MHLFGEHPSSSSESAQSIIKFDEIISRIDNIQTDMIILNSKFYIVLEEIKKLKCSAPAGEQVSKTGQAKQPPKLTPKTASRGL